MVNKIKILIIGGCFPVQDNIEKSKLYHQILKSKLQEHFYITLDIVIIRYENIFTCFKEIQNSFKTENPDWVLFHLRIEPLLGLFKLYSRYINTKGILVRTIKLSAFKINIRRKSKREIKKTVNPVSLNGVRKYEKFWHLLREANYLLGYLSGNMKYVFTSYLELLDKIILLCNKDKVKIIFTGAVSRPRSFFENYYSSKMSLFMNPLMVMRGQNYINCLGIKDENNNVLFCDDLVRVNETGHKRIAGQIYEMVVKSL